MFATAVLFLSIAVGGSPTAPRGFASELEIDMEIARLKAMKLELYGISGPTSTASPAELPAPAQRLIVYRSPKFAVEVTYNITYAQASNCTAYHGECLPMDLQLDVHSPVTNATVGVTPLPVKPAVIFFHGGGWSGGDKSGAGGQPFMAAQCQRWTSRGFVVFNVDYRLGSGGAMWDETSSSPCGSPSHKADGSNSRYSVCGDFPPCCAGPSASPWGHVNNQTACARNPFEAVPTALQNSTQCPPYTSAYPASRDAKAAVRFIRKHASAYGVSPDHLISLGCSAGGWTSTTLAIAGEDEWKAEMVGHDPTLASTNMAVSSKVQVAVVMSGGR
jgi:dienelactone hydrolase